MEVDMSNELATRFYTKDEMHGRGRGIQKFRYDLAHVAGMKEEFSQCKNNKERDAFREAWRERISALH